MLRNAVFVVSSLMVSASASAAFMVFDDLASFQTATNATSASGSLGVPHSAPDFTWGTVRVTFPSGSVMALGEWSSRLDFEFAISGPENLNYDFASDVYAAGFRFVEPQNDPNVNAPFVDSTFRISLFDGGLPVHEFDVTRPNDVASFIGVSGDTLFDRIEVREIVGGLGNEFFGEVFVGVPAPSAGLAGLLGMALISRRGRHV